MIIAGSGAALTLAAFNTLGFVTAEWALPVATATGSLILGWLAWQGWKTAGITAQGPVSAAPAMVFAFQIVNPKGWMLAALVATAAAGSGLSSFALGIMVLITLTACLSIWAGAGMLLSNWLAEGTRRLVFDRLTALAMGAFAILFAATLVSWR